MVNMLSKARRMLFVLQHALPVAAYIELGAGGGSIFAYKHITQKQPFNFVTVSRSPHLQ